MTQGDPKINEGAETWAESKIHTHFITNTVFQEGTVTICPGDQGGFYRNPWSSYGKITLLLLRKSLLSEGIYWGLVLFRKLENKVLLKIRKEVNKC